MGHSTSTPRSQAQIRAWLTSRVAHYLQLTEADIDVDVPLNRYGLDSIYAVALCGEIEDALDVYVEPTLVWDVPTVSGLSEHLSALVSAR